MTTQFREPTNEMPYWLNISVDRARLWVNRRDGVGQIRDQSFFLKDAEALLEVLLDICPNAEDIVDAVFPRECAHCGTNGDYPG